MRFFWGAVFGTLFIAIYVWLWRHADRFEPQDRQACDREQREDDASSEEKSR